MSKKSAKAAAKITKISAQPRATEENKGTTKAPENDAKIRSEAPVALNTPEVQNTSAKSDTKNLTAKAQAQNTAVAEAKKDVAIEATAQETAQAKKQKDKKAKKSKENREEKPIKEVFILVRPFVALGRYLRDSWRELRQVRWPNRKATWKMTLAVLAYCAAFIILVTLLDILFTFIFNLILG